MTQEKAKTKSDAGFTLMEMLVVLAIIGLIAAVAGPALNRGRDGSPGEFEREIMQDMLMARARAIAGQHVVRMDMDLAQREIRPSECCKRRPFPPGTIVAVLTGRELLIADQQASFLFFPDGSASGGRIALDNNAGSRSTLKLNWIDASVEATHE